MQHPSRPPGGQVRRMALATRPKSSTCWKNSIKPSFWTQAPARVIISVERQFRISFVFSNSRPKRMAKKSVVRAKVCNSNLLIFDGVDRNLAETLIFLLETDRQMNEDVRESFVEALFKHLEKLDDELRTRFIELMKKGSSEEQERIKSLAT